MVNPYVIIATHQRLSITKKNIECLLKCDVGVILVVSDQEEFAVFKNLFPHISIIHYPNNPLGNKWQVGVDVARRLKADPLIINGSDDILCPEFFTKSYKLLEQGKHFIGLKSWYVYDLKKIHHFNYTALLPLGGGRVYSKTILEKIDYRLFDTRKNRHLDDLGWWNIARFSQGIEILSEPLILSVKGDWHVMNPLEKMFVSKNARLVDTIYDPASILEKFNL